MPSTTALLGCLAIFCLICSGVAVTTEEMTCVHDLGSKAEAHGQAMLQTNRQGSGIVSGANLAPADFHTDVALTDRSKVMKAQSQEGEGWNRMVFMGSLSGLDDKGLQIVANTCCQLELELYIRRVIQSLNLELCDEGGLLSMLPLYNVCQTGAVNFATLTEHLRSAAPPNPCAFVAQPGSCSPTPRGPECQASQDPEPTAHRRRQCNARAQKGASGKCELPQGAVWCEVRLKNMTSYWMAVYDWDIQEDWVSYNVCQAGFWEESDIAEFGAPGHMLDIGGNIGYHTFAFAQAGWTVETFEPMAPNLALIGATMCRNPELAARIHLNPHGLGTSSQECTMVSPVNNVGDGFTKCGATQSVPDAGFKEIGHFNIRRLDEVLEERAIPEIDLVKIDVEGYELQVFSGAPNFFDKYKPRVILSEVWTSMAGDNGTMTASGIDYLDQFEQAGYNFFEDSQCSVPMDAKTTLRSVGGMDVVMCA